ncbi:MAG: AMP-binding protein [Stenotrophobium sp.]
MNATNDMKDWTPLSGFYAWERMQPDAIYLTQPDGDNLTDYTWAQVGSQVRHMAAHLKSLDLPAGSRIALLSKNCAHWIMADLAIWMAGHVSVPIYPSLNAETVRYILDHSEAQLMFLGRLDEWAEMRAGVAERLPIITLPDAPALGTRENVLPWQDLIAVTRPLLEKTRRSADELATLVYTSGTTGLPKGVMLSFGAFAAGSSILEQVMPFGPQDRLLSYLPLAHVFERLAVETSSLRYGCRVYFNDTLATFAADIRRARPTLFHSVPRLWVKFQLGVLQKIPQAQLDALLANPATAEATRKQVLSQLGLQDVRAAVTGSAPLPPTVLQWFRNLGLELLEGYGMSEDFSYSHLSLPGRTRLGTVGHALRGVARRIADNGEIQIKSPARMLGYYKEPEKTAEAFTEDGYFKTGDMGEIDEDGRLKITGRVKELFKTSKGKYVAPAPIENKLNNHPQVEVVCVTGCGQPQPIGLVMLNAGAQQALAAGADRALLESELQTLMCKVNSTLDPHEQLAFVVVVKEQWTITNGFLTPTMKIKRNVIEKRYESSIETWCTTKRTVIWE